MQFHAMKKLPDHPVDLRIIQRSIPAASASIEMNILGLEIHWGFATRFDTEYRVCDEQFNCYYIGNTAEECENWIKENLEDEEE